MDYYYLGESKAPHSVESARVGVSVLPQVVTRALHVGETPSTTPLAGPQILKTFFRDNG